MTSIEQRDVQAVLAGIDELLPTLRERAQETEDLRKLPDANVKALEDIGFFKLLQPEQWGGLQCDPTVFYEAVRRLASACGSTGWVAGIIGVHNWHLALFDQQETIGFRAGEHDRVEAEQIETEGIAQFGAEDLQRGQ